MAAGSERRLRLVPRLDDPAPPLGLMTPGKAPEDGIRLPASHVPRKELLRPLLGVVIEGESVTALEFGLLSASFTGRA